jgi:hypothetical protein
MMIVWGGVGVLSVLVEVPTTFGGATKTRNLILLDWEVIICACSLQFVALDTKRGVVGERDVP